MAPLIQQLMLTVDGRALRTRNSLRPASISPESFSLVINLTARACTTAHFELLGVTLVRPSPSTDEHITTAAYVQPQNFTCLEADGRRRRRSCCGGSAARRCCGWLRRSFHQAEQIDVRVSTQAPCNSAVPLPSGSDCTPHHHRAH